MRAVFLNAGPLVHFAHERTSYENSIDGIGKAIIIEDDVIVSIKDSDEVVDEYSLHHDDVDAATADLAVHDLAGQSIVPGLIDGHTHLLWAGDRSREVSWRQAGKSYAEIAAMGGGIRSTVESTRLAGDDELFALGYKRLREALRTGTTHLEAKSGYGLSTESELRLLQVASRLNGISHTPTIDSTWMGAHDTPPGTPREVYVETLLSEQLPAVVEQGIARSTDVFCEPGWFTVEESEDILRASRKAGLALRMHVDEFVDGGGAELASALGVETADHAYHTPMEVRLDMKSNGVNTGFLPGTPYAMGDQWPDMADIVEHDVPFTLATDFNPNCQTLSLPLMCSLTVQRCGMNPLLALEAVTASAAKITPHPSGRPHGVLKEGAVANFNIVDGPHWEAVCLRPSGSPFSATVLNGQFISH